MPDGWVLAGWEPGDWAVGVVGLGVVDGWGVFADGDWCTPGVIGALMGGVDGVALAGVEVGVVVSGVAVGAGPGAVAVVAAAVVDGSVC
ncbi:hypothetical protein ACFWUP_09785 [Nocardia sp. NPDC058658]|uniref:hypothetical protein n=1 Tax=Nocardia sp. NPDC058658 TaxID=3346580 RepID=UPI0036639B84